MVQGSLRAHLTRRLAKHRFLPRPHPEVRRAAQPRRTRSARTKPGQLFYPRTQNLPYPPPITPAPTDCSELCGRSWLGAGSLQGLPARWATLRRAINRGHDSRRNPAFRGGDVSIYLSLLRRTRLGTRPFQTRRLRAIRHFSTSTVPQRSRQLAAFSPHRPDALPNIAARQRHAQTRQCRDECHASLSPRESRPASAPPPGWPRDNRVWRSASYRRVPAASCDKGPAPNHRCQWSVPARSG